MLYEVITSFLAADFSEKSRASLVFESVVHCLRKRATVASSGKPNAIFSVNRPPRKAAGSIASG